MAALRRPRAAGSGNDAAPRVYLSLGSNLGDRAGNLREAVRELSSVLEDLRVSSVYETEPLYLREQPRFLNIAAAGSCRLSPQGLLERIHGIEALLGRDRNREVPKGPRPIDIDILLYGELTVDTPTLQIPHPGLRERQFVLIPLLEIDPTLRDPRSGEPYAAVSRVLAEARPPGAGAGKGGQGVYIFGPWAYTDPPGET